MNTTIYRYLFAAAVFATLTLAACRDIDSVSTTDNGPSELFVAVRLGNALTETRADGDKGGNGSEEDKGIPSYDNWSYRGFSLGDKLGFFSPHGDYNKKQKDEDDAFINEYLEYLHNTEDNYNYFGNPNIQFSTTNMDPSKCFIYMPYGGSRNTPEFELRVKSEKFGDDILRCIDYLQTQKNLEISTASGSNSATLAGTMAHSFSELIIMRGSGFDKPQKGKEQITVVLTDGFSHMEIKVPDDDKRAEGEWYCTPTLIYKENYTVDGTKMSEMECREWVAWQGTNFERTDLNNIGVPAWYVILPTLADSRSTVSYIKLYDNDGQEQRVTAIKLQHHADNGTLLGVDKQLYPGWRYPVEIRMDELVPTINPYPISPWNSDNEGKDTNITNERKRGIANQHDFGEWVQLYNGYIGGADNTEMLLLYGDMTQNRDSKEWHFYLLSDIDLADYNYNDVTNGVLIPELRDILDGRSTTLNDHEFENYTLKNLKAPLVGKLSANGQLLNMDFEEPDIQINSPDPAGILINTMDGGTIQNCNITGAATLFNPAGPVGIIVGQITGASTITDCDVTGIIWGTESVKEAGYIYGKLADNGSITLKGNKTNVTFSHTTN